MADFIFWWEIIPIETFHMGINLILVAMIIYVRWLIMGLCPYELNGDFSVVLRFFKVALLAKSKIYISFEIKYVIALVPNILELQKLFQSDIQLRRYFMLKWHETNISGNNVLFIFIVFCWVQLPIWWLIIYA